MYESEIIEPIESFEPTNLSRNAGQFQDDFQEYNSKPFHYSETQEIKKGYKILNSKSVQNKYNASDFDRINVGGRNVYISNLHDGSIKSSLHDGQYTLIDVPSRDSKVELNNLDKIYSDDFNGYRTT